MSYEKQTWSKGQVITAEKLNHIEDGIENGCNVMPLKVTNSTLNKTWKEIADFMYAGGFVILPTGQANNVSMGVVTQAQQMAGNYVVTISQMAYGMTQTYKADAEDGYPVFSN